ncbi:MAG: guanylate kinase [Nitrospiraceae bacterium]|nr:guanylate kinase [Nitrospiraceae bacterium]
MAIERRGVLFVVSAPSGAGKTTLCKELVTTVTRVHPSISYTTRTPRPGEVHGLDYYFADEQVFMAMAERNDFAESARVYGHFYGTPRQALMDMLEKGLDVLLEIDTQGAMQIKKKFSDGVYIYILPPSIDALRARLIQRGDAPEEIQRRMQKARQEILNYREYDYIVRNEDLKQASQELQAIVHAERTRTKRVDINWLEQNFIADPTTT